MWHITFSPFSLFSLIYSAPIKSDILSDCGSIGGIEMSIYVLLSLINSHNLSIQPVVPICQKRAVHTETRFQNQPLSFYLQQFP